MSKDISTADCSGAVNWVLCLDADEVLSPELTASIRQAFAKGEPKADAFWVNRRTFFLGDWIWHPNRGNTDSRSIWHNPRGKSLTVMLWGDNHVSALSIPVTTDGNLIVDPANEWW